MPFGTSLKYRLNIQFGKENVDGTTINTSLYVNLHF